MKPKHSRMAHFKPATVLHTEWKGSCKQYKHQPAWVKEKQLPVGAATQKVRMLRVNDALSNVANKHWTVLL